MSNYLDLVGIQAASKRMAKTMGGKAQEWEALTEEVILAYMNALTKPSEATNERS